MGDQPFGARVRPGRPWHRHWGFLAIVFVLLSLDEVAQLHDLGQAVVSPVLATRGVLHFGWILLAAPLVAGLGLAYLRFLRGLPARTRRLVVLAGVLYVGGALGMEMVDGWIADDLGGMSSAAYVLATTVEELPEMLGATLLVYTLASLPGRPTDQPSIQRASSEPQGRPISG